nr:MAG TPA: hypothetical protein [Caudoviricetes sp.]
MIEVYDEYEKQHVMINVSKIRIVYNGKYTKKTMIQRSIRRIRKATRYDKC